MDYNQGEFLVSLSELKTNELIKQLRQTVTETLECFLKMYVNEFDQLEEAIKMFNAKGYHYHTKIGIYLDLLTIKETNETKRLMFEDCLKCRLGLAGFLYPSGNIEYEYAKLFELQIQAIRDKVEIENKLSESCESKKNELLAEYMGISSKLSLIDKRKIIDKYNHAINYIITLLIKLDAKLKKGLTDRVIY